MNVVATYRVKNEARWIRESIRRTLEVANTVLVLDDKSDDGTPEIAASTSEAVMVYEKGKYQDALDWGLGEVSDREFLLKKAVGYYGAQWVVAIDGDEVLTPTAIAEMKHILDTGKRGAYFFRVAYLWDTPDLERVDGVYGNIKAAMLYAVHSKDSGQLDFRRTSHGANMHCGRIPESYFFPSYNASDSALVKHYGYMHAEDRERKHAFYRKQDTATGLAIEGGYDHILGKPTHWAPGPVQLRSFVDK